MSDDTTRILIILPHKKPFIEEIENTYEAKQNLINRYVDIFLRSAFCENKFSNHDAGIGQEVHLTLGDPVRGVLALHTIHTDKHDRTERSIAKMYTANVSKKGER